ncbi:MAG: hypothetical protein H6557_31685 [Lewinellaceae bacterium]|nr:hypothetical protein [Lewinellaceae bacterium]
MPVLDMLRLGYIIHSAHRTGTGFFTTTAFTVHGANIGRGIFFAFAMVGFGMGCVMIVALVSCFGLSRVMIMARMVVATITSAGSCE